MRDAGPSGNSRKQGGADDGHLVAGGEVVFRSLLERLVVGGDALFKVVELGVAEDLPPFAAQHSVGGIGGVPRASGGIGWRYDRGGAGFLVGRRCRVGW